MKGKKVLILMTAMLLLGACTNGKEDCKTKESQTPSPVTQENSAESVSESVSESLQSETEGESTEADVTMPTFNVNDFYADDAQGDGGNGGGGHRLLIVRPGSSSDHAVRASLRDVRIGRGHVRLLLCGQL